ncbi:endo-1,4-beta-xylanase [Streptomyces sp. CNQ085]|uniref:endo-1,4-beta-xylanase n=1 Tax=Streptomyces sp. CNQ085 TaxID=2886944 RepID=UPI001F50E9A3|nr:endo-1,4-beta-xylanase [Streptomyces sp. CNQ085]MCI0383326.1 endo-1,4-beta-xylanase [Streptomyces sp. CNQ085]
MRQHRVRTVRRSARAAVAVSVTAAALTLGFSAPSRAADPSLREVAESTGRFIGTAVNDGLLGNGTHSSIVSTESDSVTAENTMRWEAVEPRRGRFDRAGGDRLMRFAQDNDQLVHGHTLVWHSQMPGWLRNGSFSDSELRRIMTDHVTTQAGRHRGKVQRWDVVNEAFDEDGSPRQSKFYQRLGPSRIADSFRATRAADPNAKLFINDYDTETVNVKSDGLYRLVRDLLAQDVPIDGVGFQNHLIVGNVNGQAIRRNLQRFADPGLEVAATELDIRMRMPSDSSKLQWQARDYRAVADACLTVSRCSGITVTDAVHNGTVPAGGTVSFGFRTSAGAAQDGTRVSLGGQECAAG